MLILVQFCVPPFASKGFTWAEIGKLTGHILQNSIMMSWSPVYPYLQVAAILFIVGIIFGRNSFRKAFSIYAALCFCLFALGQNISITEEYGIAVLNLNLLMFFFVAAFWFWEAFLQRNDFSAQPRLGKYWVFIPALFSFWFPMNRNTLSPDFNPVYFFTSGSALTFCMMTPLFLAVLITIYPRVNLVTLRVTASIGLIIGFYNMLVNFVLEPSSWWNGVLHFPLVLLSIYGLILSFRTKTSEQRHNLRHRQSRKTPGPEKGFGP